MIQKNGWLSRIIALSVLVLIGMILYTAVTVAFATMVKWLLFQ